MSVSNAYPNLIEIPYKKTSVDMAEVISYINETNYLVEVKRACYVLFRNESGNGNNGVCNNYIGLQADGAKSDEFVSPKIVATCVQAENMTGKQRRFACFNSFKDSVDVIEHNVINRGIFIGGKSHPYSNIDVKTPHDLALAYYKEWVIGSYKATPDEGFINDFISMYNQAINKFK